MPADEWWTYVLLFFADDFAYYWFHRWRHRLGYVFRGPGWSPDGSGGGTRG
jgi:sterol desaturase/sphingolipid hydroxylase (fatty acid hydroxylase superfamily)